VNPLFSGPFDTHAYIKRLESAGISPEQAEAHAEAMVEALRGGVATRADLMEVKSDLEKQITRLDGRFTLLSWMVGVVMALCLAILGKLLIVHL